MNLMILKISSVNFTLASLFFNTYSYEDKEIFCKINTIILVITIVAIPDIKDMPINEYIKVIARANSKGTKNKAVI